MAPARRATPAPDGPSTADRKTFISPPVAHFLRAEARRNGTGTGAVPVRDGTLSVTGTKRHAATAPELPTADSTPARPRTPALSGSPDRPRRTQQTAPA
ncbi:hypothetical protein [Streptomyces sp. NPDC055692]|uniref:hypothetical protein n=1 Tax=Streptomyces sp. NPDC055692 TaxID=3155683 RepID=UPI00343F092F